MRFYLWALPKSVKLPEQATGYIIFMNQLRHLILCEPFEKHFEAYPCGTFWQLGYLFTDNLSRSAFYVILSMGAMMGAVLQAALMAVMELLGLQYKQNPISMALNRASVGSQMSKRFIRVANLLSWQEAQSYADQDCVWLLMEKNHAAVFILRLEYLKIYLASAQDTSVDLAKIPGLRKDVTRILLQETLSEAFDKLQISGVQALVIVRMSAPLIESPVGILTREDIESFYSRA